MLGQCGIGTSVAGLKTAVKLDPPAVQPLAISLSRELQNAVNTLNLNLKIKF